MRDRSSHTAPASKKGTPLKTKCCFRKLHSATRHRSSTLLKVMVRLRKRDCLKPLKVLEPPSPSMLPSELHSSWYSKNGEFNAVYPSATRAARMSLLNTPGSNFW